MSEQLSKDLMYRIADQLRPRIELGTTGDIAFKPKAVVLPNTIQIATEDPDTMIEVSFRLVSKK